LHLHAYYQNDKLALSKLALVYLSNRSVA